VSQSAVQITDVQAGGSITITGVTVGLNGPGVQELIKAAVAGVAGPLADKIADLSQRLGVTECAALALLRLLSDDVVSIERLPDALANAANQIIIMRRTLNQPSNDQSGIAGIRQQAVSALDSGGGLARSSTIRIRNLCVARSRGTGAT
jgi:hypothetical protein